MPHTPAEPPVTDDAWVSALTERLSGCYGISAVKLAFLGGELDRNYRVSTTTGDLYLAKLQVRRESRTDKKWQDDILAHVADQDLAVAVPTVVPNNSGARSTVVDAGPGYGRLSVLNWVHGTELARVDDHSDDLLTELGATAARVTNALNGFPPSDLPTTHHWDITRSREAIQECIDADPYLAEEPYIHTVLQWFDEIEPLLSTLPPSVVHQDLNDNNVLVEARDGGDQAIAGVLDFNDALFSVRVAEVAIAGAYAMLRKDAPLAALGHVVAGYHGVNPLTEDELAVIYPMAVARLCVQALTWTTRGRTNPTAYGSMRMRHTLPTLQLVLTIHPDDARAHLNAVCGLSTSEKVQQK
ncbi:phosphotransferase [Mycolicibacterium sp. YH-1]|uniref:phosphotransferase n=1 Tax=Mycolicibacterium sp. YH-1 TaxID=2908837 RepID=UPI001F4C4463|nr:phosphotransferase [Mycolicibacterium sp. YH-1]UNB55008.1 phosphotransferase [Mycolicibacterium sp. YH-1]